MKPIYTHDCPKCKYLGSMFIGQHMADWYKCTDSVIARHGDDGPEYWSMPTGMVMDDRYLTALRQKDGATGYTHMQVLARFMLQQESKESTK